jgi:hypothetical protein
VGYGLWVFIQVDILKISETYLIYYSTICMFISMAGMRVEGALQYMAYGKMLKLRNGGEGVLSQCITFCTNEQERIFECVFSGVLAIGT